jgi:hypothetical protein
MIAKVKKNQVNLNRAIKWLEKYNAFNILRDEIEGQQENETSEWRRINKKCEDSFDKYQDYCNELPAYQVKLIENSELY